MTERLEPIDMPSQEDTTKHREEYYQYTREMIVERLGNNNNNTSKAMKLLEELWSKMNAEGHVHHWIYNDKYFCRINRNAMGVWCGYVSVPEGHPTYGMHYDQVEQKYNNDLNVHGGLTFSELVHNWGKDMWVFGFDCGHAFDMSFTQITMAVLFSDMEITYKDKAYVIRETNDLARQLEEIEENGV